jgi:hypothetical protein
VILKAIRGSSFAATLKYLFSKPDATLLATWQLFGENLKEWTLEFEAEAFGSRRVEYPVYHLIISLHPGDRPLTTDDLFKRLIEATLAHVDLAEHQWLAVRHYDTSHDHVHVVVNRVFNHRAAPLVFDHLRLQAIARQLEAQFRLVQAKKRQPEGLKTLRVPASSSPNLQAPTGTLPMPWREALARTQGLRVSPTTPLGRWAEQLPNLAELSPQELLETWLTGVWRLRRVAAWIGREKRDGRVIPSDTWQLIHTESQARDRAALALLTTWPAVLAQLKPRRAANLRAHALDAERLAAQRAPYYINAAHHWRRARDWWQRWQQALTQQSPKRRPRVEQKIVQARQRLESWTLRVLAMPHPEHYVSPHDLAEIQQTAAILRG